MSRTLGPRAPETGALLVEQSSDFDRPPLGRQMKGELTQHHNNGCILTQARRRAQGPARLAADPLCGRSSSYQQSPASIMQIN